MVDPSCILMVGIDQFVVTIGGHTVRGWSEDADALMMPDANEMATIRRGGDGQLLGSFTNNIGGAVSIKLLSNSPSTAFFMQIVTSLLEDGRRSHAVCWDGKVENTSQGYSFDLHEGLMISSPLGQTAGKGEVANQIFTWEFTKIVPRYEEAVFGFGTGAGSGANSLTTVQNRNEAKKIGGIETIALPSES